MSLVNGMRPVQSSFRLDLTLGCHVLHLHLETGEAAMLDLDEQH